MNFKSNCKLKVYKKFKNNFYNYIFTIMIEKTILFYLNFGTK